MGVAGDVEHGGDGVGWCGSGRRSGGSEDAAAGGGVTGSGTGGVDAGGEDVGEGVDLGSGRGAVGGKRWAGDRAGGGIDE